MRAVTDSGPTQPGQEMSEPVKNLFTIMEVISPEDTYRHYLDLYNRAEIRYGDMKKQLAEDIITFTAPIREKVEEIKNDRAYLRRVVHQGAEKARASAAKTVREVREIIGFKPF